MRTRARSTVSGTRPEPRPEVERCHLSEKRWAFASPNGRDKISRLPPEVDVATSAAIDDRAPRPDPATKRRDVAKFVHDERATTTDARLFAFSSYRILSELEKAAGGRIPTRVVERMIATFNLVGRRGGAVRPTAFRVVWQVVKQEKEEEAARRAARRSDKADWRSAIANPGVERMRPVAELRPGGDAPTRSRGPPSIEATDFDLEAEISALFADHRARLPQMPIPKIVRNGTQS